MTHPFTDLADRERDPVIVVEHDKAIPGHLTLGIKSGTVRHLVMLPNEAAANLAWNILDVLTRAGYSVEGLLRAYSIVQDDRPSGRPVKRGRQKPPATPEAVLADLAGRMLRGFLR